MRTSFASAAVGAVLLVAGAAGAETFEVEGKAWLARYPEPAAINVHGIWQSRDWGMVVLNQKPGSREVTGTGDDWQIRGVVSANQLWLVFFYPETDRHGERNGRQKLGFSAMLAPAGETTLQGSYEGGLAKGTPSGKAISMTRTLPGPVGMNAERPWSDYIPSVPPDKAFVFVYRTLSRQDNGYMSKPGFFIDERKVADAANGAYFIAKVLPGRHRVHSTEKNAEVTLDTQPGEKYYVRIELAGGLPAKFRVRAASAEEGDAEVRTLLPLDSSRIIDSKMVLVPGFDETDGDSAVSQHR